MSPIKLDTVRKQRDLDEESNHYVSSCPLLAKVEQSIGRRRVGHVHVLELRVAVVLLCMCNVFIFDPLSQRAYYYMSV